jgi:pimeloyl-ACP methyl ester carboxylesterase
MGGAGSFLGARMVDAKMSNVWARYRAQGLKSEEVEVDGGETVIRCWVPWEQPERGVWSAGAADKPVVVFLHGFVAGATINWEHQISAFTKDFNVYVPDLVFFGGSSSSRKERTESFQAHCVAKMLHALDVYNEVSTFLLQKNYLYSLVLIFNFFWSG